MASAHTRALLFDEARDRRLAEVFAPCFTLLLNLRSADQFGEPDVLRRRINGLLDRTAREAQRSGLPSDDVHTAQFAIVAFLDETVLSSNWMHKAQWLSQPLQLERFNRYDAGEEFFTRLEQLRTSASAHDEVLEVYYLCLALGFRGKYQLHDQDQLRRLVEDTYADLSRSASLSVSRLSPNGEPRDQVTNEVRRQIPAWVIAVAAVVIGLMIYIGMSVHVSRQAQDAVQLVEQLR